MWGAVTPDLPGFSFSVILEAEQDQRCTNFAHRGKIKKVPMQCPLTSNDMVLTLYEILFRNPFLKEDLTKVDLDGLLGAPSFGIDGPWIYTYFHRTQTCLCWAGIPPRRGQGSQAFYPKIAEADQCLALSQQSGYEVALTTQQILESKHLSINRYFHFEMRLYKPSDWQVQSGLIVGAGCTCLRTSLDLQVSLGVIGILIRSLSAIHS